MCRDIFQVQALREPTRRERLWELVLTSADVLIREAKIGGSLDCSDHSLVEFVRIVSLARS